MDYTEKQYALLCRLESGLMYYDLTDHEQETLRYLDQNGLVQPRADIKDGFYTLSQHGLRVLSAYRKSAQNAEQIARDHAEQKRNQSRSYKLQIAQLLAPFVIFFLGLAVEHYTAIFAWVLSLFKR